MGIGSYKEAERYRMRTNKNLTRGFYLDTKRTLDEEPFAWEQSQDAGIMQPEAVQGFAEGGLVELSDGRYQYRAYRSGKQTKRIFDTKKEAVEFQKQFETENPKKPNIIELQGTKEELLKDKEFLKDLKSLDKDIKIAEQKGYVNIARLRDKYAEGYGYYQVEEIKKRLQNLSEKVHTVKNSNLEKATDEYISIAKGRDLNRGEVTKIIKKNNVPNTGMLYKTLKEIDALREIPIDSDLAKSNKAKVLREIQDEFTDLGYEKSTGKYRIRGTNTVNLSHLDDKYSQYVTTNNLGYAPKDINAELLKPFDEALHNIYLEREKLLKDKPPGFEIEVEKLNQRGISLADRSQGFKNFNVVQPDGSSYSYTPDIKRTIDPANLLKGKKVQDLTEADKQLINLNKGMAYAYNQEIDPKILEELKGQSTELLNILGCGQKYADGGKIKFGNGSNCYNKGLAKVESGKLTKGEQNLVKNFINKIPAPVKAVGKVFGLADVALDAIFALPYLATGDVQGAIRSSTAGLLGAGKSIDEELLELTENEEEKEKIQRALNNLTFVPELRGLTEEKQSLEEYLKNPLDEEQASIYFQNLNSVNERIKNIQDTLGKKQYTEEDQKTLLDFVNKLAGSKSETAESWFGPELKQVQGPTTKQRIFDRILEERGIDQYIPEEVLSKARGKVVPFEIPEIQSPDDSMREGFKKGGMSKRGFLKLLGGTVATGAVAPDLIKAIKGGKKATQAGRVASKIKLEPAEGMYPWFPKLVEKVKEMGKPFEEKNLIMEPSYKNDPRPFGSRLPTGEEKLTKHVDGDTTFILREYPDGRLAVDIDSPRNQESFGQPVSLYYRPKMEIQNYKGEKKIEPPEFKVLEPEPTLFANGPDDVDITFTEVPKNPKRNTVFGDIEAAERFATGNIKNRKIIPVKQSLRDEMSDDPSTFIMRQSGELGSKAQPEEIIKLPEEIIKLPEKFATGGRVKFAGGGKVKFARMITDILDSLRQKLSFSSHLEKLYGTEKAKEKILSPYRLPEGTNKSQHSDILMYIDESRQNLPKEYNDLQNILNEIEKDISNYDYVSADKKGRTLLDRLPESFNFEKLSQDLFPMEDPLNNAIILMDPQRNNMRGRFVNKVRVDPETKRGTIETFDTFDTENKKWLSEDEWKLKGVESYEKGKEGLN